MQPYTLHMYSMPIPIPLQINCGYARVAIRELSSPEKFKNRTEIANEQRRQGFLRLFSSATYNIPDQYQSGGSRQFDKHCDRILNHISSKWHPSAKRSEYLSMFSIENWKHLTSSDKGKHTLAFCAACYNDYQNL